METLVKTEMPNEIKSLDLERIKWKLRESEERKAWSHEMCDFAEREYKRFLTLIKLYPGKTIVPNKLMDKMWHQHILDTRAYAKDCQKVFGRFLHHYPYFGMYGKDDKQNLVDAFEETNHLYEQCFQENMSDFEASRCTDHPCHAPTPCACRTPEACR